MLDLLTIENIISCTVIWAVFMFGIWRGFVVGCSAPFVVNTPNLLTSLGVLGTFVGIFFGLLGFDVSDIDASVPALLEGMKFAFLSSVVGMGASIAFRLISFAFTVPETESPNDVMAFWERMSVDIEAISKSISGDQDGSILMQLKNTRLQQQDHHKEQIEQFRRFAETLSENNSNALIEALKGLIHDFNNKISEQFGDNFKELNAAVGRMVDWQDQYKEQMSVLEEKLVTATKTIELSRDALMQCEESIAKVTTETDRIPDLLLSIRDAVDEGNDVTEKLGGLLGGMAEMREKAVSAFPLIEKNLETITTKLTQSVNDITDTLSTSQLELNTKLLDISSQNQDTMNKNFEVFDDLMQKELQRVLQLMGDQLASISQKLARDYDDFAEAAQVVIAAARGQEH